MAQENMESYKKVCWIDGPDPIWNMVLVCYIVDD